MSAEYDRIIYDVAVRDGFTPTAARLVVAQARLESADYSSGVFRTNTNTSGMKYIGQPLATRGTLAPKKERSDACKRVTESQVGGYGPAPCLNRDHYAKFASVRDSIRDVVERLYRITKNGVTPEQLRNSKTPEQFADLLKRRNYYGDGDYGTPAADRERANYSAGLKAKLLRIQIVEVIDRNKGKVALGIGLVLAGFIYYFYIRKKIK